MAGLGADVDIGLPNSATREQAFRTQALKHLQRTAVEMGVMGVLGSLALLLFRLMLPAPEYVGLRFALLPLTAVFAYLIIKAPTVTSYGWACVATIFLISLNCYLGSLGTDRPLMYYLPAAIIIVLATSFFWITIRQWIGGTAVCYVFFLPFVIEHNATHADTVFSIFFAGMTLVAGFVSHQRLQEYQRYAFDQECRLAELSTTDALTGARSRAEFLHRAEATAIAARAMHAPVTLLYLDIDHFKRLNDGYGHAAGDAVLRGVGKVLQQALGEGDFFGRLGGEEFCVVMPYQGKGEALELVQRLRILLAAVPRPDATLTVSAGIADMLDGESIMQTMHRADLAMLKAKQAGRNTVLVADEDVSGLESRSVSSVN